MAFLHYCIYLLFSLSYAAKWVELETVPSASYDYGVYETAEIVHYVFCKNDTSSGVVYLRRYNNGTVEKRSEIPYQGMCRSAQITVYGKNIYIAFQSVKYCGSSSYACSYVLYTNSTNGGFNWSQVIPVDGNIAGVFYNYNPLIIHEPYSGAVIVAYKSLKMEKPTIIKVAKKYASRSHFEIPTSVVQINQSTIIPGGFSFFRSSYRIYSDLGLVWQDKHEDSNYMHNISYASSVGGKWAVKKVIGETNLYDQASSFIAIKSSLDIYLVYSRTDKTNRGIWLRHSKDKGKTWQDTVRVSKIDDYVSVTARVCVVKGEYRLYILAQDQFLDKTESTFGYWVTTDRSMKVTWLGNPYKDAMDDCLSPHIACVEGGVLLTCKVNTGKQNYKIMMASY